MTFVCWKWVGPVTYRSRYDAATVLRLERMLRRHYHRPHRFVCVTDDATGLGAVTTLPIWSDYAAVCNPNGAHNPSCYRRLKAFSADAADWFGPEFVSLDLDTVIVGDITNLFDRTEDFVIWGESDFPRTQYYNGSLWYLKAGTRTQVWTDFNPKTSPVASKLAGARGSDQGWISHVLGPNEATFTKDDGVYSFRKDVIPLGGVLPPNARLVNFHGHTDPWMPAAQQFDWVRQHYGDVREAV